jgi:transposase
MATSARPRTEGRLVRGLQNPENLTNRQASKLATIQQTNVKPYRAYLLKEQLRQICRLAAPAAERLLDRRLAWARRCRLPSFVKLARTITEQRDGILAAIQRGLSDARIEQINTQIRLIGNTVGDRVELA